MVMCLKHLQTYGDWSQCPQCQVPAQQASHKIDCFHCYTTGVTQGETTGLAVERERIIALLEEHLIPVAASGNDGESFGWREGMRNAIALIKGENATERTGSTLPNAQQGEKPNENPWKGCPGCPECEGENK